MIMHIEASLLFLAGLYPPSDNDRDISAPKIMCDIEMPNWCIAHLDASIEMSDREDVRVWSIRRVGAMEAGPLLIFESKNCAVRGRLVSATDLKIRVGKMGEEAINVRRYEIADTGCYLEFRWPLLGGNDSSYERTIDYGILVGNSTKTMQLHKFDGK